MWIRVPRVRVRVRISTPFKNPYPWWRVRVLEGKGQGYGGSEKYGGVWGFIPGVCHKSEKYSYIQVITSVYLGFKPKKHPKCPQYLLEYPSSLSSTCLLLKCMISKPRFVDELKYDLWGIL